MPRPVVLEANLTEENLGLGDRELRWVADHCDAMIHNAASLVFVQKEGSGEPYSSNVGGTENVLAVCRRAGIERFHHVSTAYVSGLRSGTILESELDVGQESANDYERSKVRSERLVREADHLRSLTVFRPGIIVGDSRSGYTSTFQGFYMPLQAASGLRSLVPSGVELSQEDVLGAFGMDGSESKNLIPVDWVSAVMTHVVASPELHGQTYHLTPREPTPVGVMASSIRYAFDRSTPERDAKATAAGPDPESFLGGILEQTDVYRAYWRDDPRFDDTNTRRATPHLPCPDVDEAMLKRTAAYAVKVGFGWPKPKPSPPDRDLHRVLANLLPRAPHAGSTDSLGLSVSGPGGGEWTITFRGDDPTAYDDGVRDNTTCVRLNNRTLDLLLGAEVSVEDATLNGLLGWRGAELGDIAVSERRLGRLIGLLCGAVRADAPLNGHSPGVRDRGVDVPDADRPAASASQVVP